MPIPREHRCPICGQLWGSNADSYRTAYFVEDDLGQRWCLEHYVPTLVVVVEANEPSPGDDWALGHVCLIEDIGTQAAFMAWSQESLSMSIAFAGGSQ